jgi:AAA family ATP:ADP antiporter
VLLAASTALTLLVSTREARHLAEAQKKQPKAPEPPPPDESGQGPFALVFRHRYLLLVALFSLIFTFANTNGEYVKDALIPELAHRTGLAQGLSKVQIDDLRSAMFGSFYTWVNVAGVLLQSFFVSRIVKYLGLRRAFFILPFIALLDATTIALVPIWSFVRVGKIAENATDYSLNNTLRNMLWLPTTRRMKYLAKQAVDTFFVRAGDVSSAICVLVFAQLLGMNVRVFGIINIVLVAIWIVLARAIVRENAKLTHETPAGADAGEART